MRIVIKYTNLDSTPAMQAFIEDKIGAVAKLLKRWEEGRELTAMIEVARTTKHHHKGDVFYAEASIELPGKLLRAEEKAWDIRQAIDKVKQKLKLEITRFKERGALRGEK